jgi:hypothetical protein
MKAAVKAAWQAKLRSGEFAQGSGQLRTWNSAKKVWEYCCLGVLCEISGLGQWKTEVQHGFRDTTYLGSKHYLPVEVAEWAGIDPDCESEEGAQQRLGSLNDSGASFRTIAVAISTDDSL